MSRLLPGARPDTATGTTAGDAGWAPVPWGEPFLVLVIEDSPSDARLVREMLEAAWPLELDGPLEIVHVERLADAYPYLSAGVACVLLDLWLPDAAGIESMLQVRVAAPAVPVVVLSGLDDEALAVEAVHRGAQDYLMKGQVDGALVRRAIRYAVERKRIEAELEAREELNRAVLDSMPAAVAVLDGQGVIVSVNQTWAMRAAGHGGDVLWSGVGMSYPEACARAMGPGPADAVRATAGIRAVLDGAEGSLSMDYTVATPQGEQRCTLNVWPLALGQGGAVASHVEHDRHEPPRTGPSTGGPVTAQAASAAGEAALRAALAREELRVFFQPQVRLDSGAVLGFEALVRWCHPELGLLEPAAFLPTAEATGLVVPVGRWVLRAACQEAAGWPAPGPGLPPPRLAVNLSARQLADPGLVGEVAATLAATGLGPERLCLEVTETAAAGAAAGAVLHALARLGVSLAVDDLGSGPASLVGLCRLPVDTVKVDRSVVAGLGQRPDAAAVVAAVAGLAGAVGLEVVAEGVETGAQLAEVRRLGCAAAQGFLFAAPRSGEVARGLVAECFPVGGDPTT
jgi:EAL domain-containing protein (putative c-di-GMP-specific phosphodiesterase class I)/DNA-binding NarL/FixJ family response regulator